MGEPPDGHSYSGCFFLPSPPPDTRTSLASELPELSAAGGSATQCEACRMAAQASPGSGPCPGPRSHTPGDGPIISLGKFSRGF
ncbi:hypothetical protein H8959_017750 [Pygathrix nigripes]